MGGDFARLMAFARRTAAFFNNHWNGNQYIIVSLLRPYGMIRVIRFFLSPEGPGERESRARQPKIE